MSSLNPSRRAFLSSGAAAATVAAIVPATSAPVIASAPDVAPVAPLAAAINAARETESQELLKLGADLMMARKRYADALAAMEPAQVSALEMAPAIPEGLAVPFAVGLFGQIGWFGIAEPTDILGNPVDLPPYISPRSGKEFKVRIPSPDNIIDYLRKRKWVCGATRVPADERAECRRLYDLAVAYDAALDEAREASGLLDARDELGLARFALRQLALEIRRSEAKTIVGLLIKAQAANAAGSMLDDDDPSAPRLTAGWIGIALAEDFERVMAGEAA